MRKKQTFLLTVMTPEDGTNAFRGQIKAIASGKTSNFTSLEELYRLLAVEMGDEAAPIRSQLDMLLKEENALL